MIVTRFAPSPTGYLHIGGLRTALFNYLYAKKSGGKFLLRIEDTDMARNSKEAAEAILESFKWVGIQSDGEIVYQSQRFDLYRDYAEKLLESGHAYRCYMSKDELESERERAQKEGKVWQYDRRWRDADKIPPKNVEPVIRIKAPMSGEIRFTDGVKGEMCFSASELDDFIILRSDGTPTYNFVVAIDDALMGVTDVIRGDDHLSNTPRQIVVYNALGLPVPRFFHVPMILGSDGAKLSKRHGALGVMEYQKMGFLPESVLNFLLRLGFSHGDKEIFSREEMMELFSPFNLTTSPSSYNYEKFLWLNAHYIKEADEARLLGLLGDFGVDVERVKSLGADRIAALFGALKQRAQTLVEFGDGIEAVLKAPSEYDAKMKEKADMSLVDLASTALESLGDLADFTPISIDKFLHDFAESKGLKLGKFMPLLRLALLGKPGGIGLGECIYIIGLDEAKARFGAFQSGRIFTSYFSGCC